ncbi:IclR family transcriptional regulator [Streptomyces sp. NPDC055078]
MSAPPPRRPHHRTVDRIAQILDFVARERNGLTLTEIAGRLGAPVSSVQALVNGLAASSFLAEENRRFTLGPTPYVLNLTAGRQPVRSVHHADLELLHSLTRATVVLGIAVGGQVVYIDHVSTTNSNAAYAAETHIRRPLLRTCTGRVLLAHSDKRDLYAYLSSAPSDEQPFAEGFMNEVDDIREKGLAISLGYMRNELSGIAAPVTEAGRVVAAVALVGPREQMDKQLDSLGRTLRTQALAWSHRFTGESPR